MADQIEQHRPSVLTHTHVIRSGTPLSCHSLLATSLLTLLTTDLTPSAILLTPLLMLDGKPARSHGAYTSIRTSRTPSFPPSVCPPPTPEVVHERIHDRVFKYLYKHADFLIPFELYTREIYRSVSFHPVGR